MQIINLYRVIRPDGGVTVTPNKPDNYEKVMYRIVADEGKELVNGDTRTTCADVESAAGWTETEIKESTETELEDAIAALNLLGVEAK